MRGQAKQRAFYGWWVLAASVVIELFGLGFGIICFRARGVRILALSS